METTDLEQMTTTLSHAYNQDLMKKEAISNAY